MQSTPEFNLKVPSDLPESLLFLGKSHYDLLTRISAEDFRQEVLLSVAHAAVLQKEYPDEDEALDLLLDDEFLPNATPGFIGELNTIWKSLDSKVGRLSSDNS